jgi:hypothetical protein
MGLCEPYYPHRIGAVAKWPKRPFLSQAERHAYIRVRDGLLLPAPEQSPKLAPIHNVFEIVVVKTRYSKDWLFFVWEWLDACPWHGNVNKFHENT